MSVRGLNHVNIRTTDIAATVRFYTDILGLRYDGAEEVNGFPRNWLLDQRNKPIIHLRELAPEGNTRGPVDHVAIDCDDMASVILRLEQAQIEFAMINTLVDGVTQVFIKDPNGVTLELNFVTQAP